MYHKLLPWSAARYKIISKSIEWGTNNTQLSIDGATVQSGYGSYRWFVNITTLLLREESGWLKCIVGHLNCASAPSILSIQMEPIFTSLRMRQTYVVDGSGGRLFHPGRRWRHSPSTDWKEAESMLLISTKENPSNNFDISPMNELINYLCIA